MNAEYSLRARWVLPMEGPALAGGVVTVEGDRVTNVGLPGPSTGRLKDLGDVVLLPGLVNAHTHLEFSGLPQPLGKPHLALSDWIRLVIADRKRSGRDAVSAIERGLDEGLQLGVTTVGEIATAPAAAYPAEDLPHLTLFQEVIGFSRARKNAVLADVEKRLANCPMAAKVGISPHAPYTVHPQLFEALVDLSAQKNSPIAVHLAESREELQLLGEGNGPLRDLLEEKSMWDAEAIPRGSRPVDYLKILARAPRVLVIHGNFLRTDEIEFIGHHRERMAVVYCPRTHAYFGHAPYPLEKMLSAGVRVALGTDSRASNPDLSLLEELRFVFRQFPRLSPERILAMGTSAGASALGLSGVAGSIAVGKHASFTAVPCGGNSTDPATAVLQSNRPPNKTWLCGREV